MKIRYIVMLMVAVLMMTGCKKEVDFHGEEGERHVVVMAQMEPDSLVCVNLSYTKFFLNDQKPEPINSAEMKLWVNDKVYGPERIVGGNYWFGVRPQEGDSLRMYAKVPGEGELHAKSVMVGKPDIEGVIAFKPKEIDFIHMMDVYYLRFQLNDNAALQDNYRIEVINHVQREEYGEEDAIDTVHKVMFLFTDLQEVGDTAVPSILGAMPAGSLFVTDSNWNGEEKQVTLMVGGVVDTAYLMQRTYFVRVANYSSEMRKWKFSMATAGGNMFMEPYRVYSNIEGGLGVFASKSEIMCKAILKEK